MDDDTVEVDETQLPRVPMWPVWAASAVALLGAVIFALHPSGPVFWAALLLFQMPLWIALDWRSDRAEKLGYRNPTPPSAPDADGWGMWGPP